jgi:hypothetical protein
MNNYLLPEQLYKFVSLCNKFFFANDNVDLDGFSRLFQHGSLY